MPIYLDYNATAPMHPKAAEKLAALLAAPHNASSVHAFGREAKKELEAARTTIAAAVSAWKDEVIFTGSGTESNITALRGFPTHRLLVAASEHSSVLKARPCEIIPVDGNGIIDLAMLSDILADGTPTLVSVMLANNETGVLQPISEIASLCKKHGALLHTDAVQAIGKIPVDFGALGADILTISCHKCGGPVGAAALIVRRHLPFQPLLTGGGQESNRRAGTENIPAIAAFATALEQIDLSHMQNLRSWLDAMETELESYGAIVFGKNALRLPNTSCIAMPGVSGEIQLMDFDLSGLAVSTGSACSSGRIEASHVLGAMQIPKETALCAVRISGGWATEESHIKQFTSAWIKTCCRLSKTAIQPAAMNS